MIQRWGFAEQMNKQTSSRTFVFQNNEFSGNNKLPPMHAKFHSIFTEASMFCLKLNTALCFSCCSQKKLFAMITLEFDFEWKCQNRLPHHKIDSHITLRFFFNKLYWCQTKTCWCLVFGNIGNDRASDGFRQGRKVSSNRFVRQSSKLENIIF